MVFSYLQVDGLIKANNEMKLRLAEKEVLDKECQTVAPKRRNSSTQTDSEDKSSKPKNFISFFNSKNLFAKKPKKRVKFLKKGSCRQGEISSHFSVLPGFLPPPSSAENEYVLPNASQMSRLLKRPATSPESKEVNKRAKKAKVDAALTSPKKSTKKSGSKQNKDVSEDPIEHQKCKSPTGNKQVDLQKNKKRPTTESNYFS